MKLNTKSAAVCGLLATFALTSLTPVLADPGSQQKNKNQWRNLGIAGAVIAGYGLLEHNQTATILGAAGAAYSANRYEQDRQHQSQDTSNRQWYHRNYGNGRSYGWNPNSQNNNGQYNNSGQYGQYNNNGRYGQYDNNYGSSNNSDQFQHHGKGWYKNHGNDDQNDDRE